MREGMRGDDSRKIAKRRISKIKYYPRLRIRISWSCRDGKMGGEGTR